VQLDKSLGVIIVAIIIVFTAIAAGNLTATPAQRAASARASEVRAEASSQMMARIGEGIDALLHGAADCLIALGLLFGMAVVIFAMSHMIVTAMDAQRIHADHSGQYPIVKMQRGDRIIYYDPNRAPTAVTSFEPDGRPGFALPDSAQELQALAVRGAQQTQTMRAAVSGERVHRLPTNINISGELPPLRRLGHVEVIDPLDLPVPPDDDNEVSL